MNPTPFQIVDRDDFSHKFLRAIKPLRTPELREFLDDSVQDNRGTDGEASIIALIEDQLAVRELLEQD